MHKRGTWLPSITWFPHHMEHNLSDSFCKISSVMIDFSSDGLESLVTSLFSMLLTRILIFEVEFFLIYNPCKPSRPCLWWQYSQPPSLYHDDHFFGSTLECFWVDCLQQPILQGLFLLLAWLASFFGFLSHSCLGRPTCPLV